MTIAVDLGRKATKPTNQKRTVTIKTHCENHKDEFKYVTLLFNYTELLKKPDTFNLLQTRK